MAVYTRRLGGDVSYVGAVGTDAAWGGSVGRAARPGRVAGTMGAGDSFIAGFLHSWLEGLDIPGCMAAGARCSAVTLAYEGAW